MRYSAFILAATAVLSAVYCNVYVEQKFSSGKFSFINFYSRREYFFFTNEKYFFSFLDSWKSHWIHTENPKFNGRFSAGKYFNGEQEDQGRCN